MNREERTRVPSDAPRSFVRPNWAPFVFTDGGIDRCYYELCALSELSWVLQAGDIWVPGSRRYLKFDSYLIEPAVWAERKEKVARLEFCIFTPVLSPIPQRVEGVFACVHPGRGR
jgi:hypothetical protein